jgi:DNA repair exonuclease SbcCD nuclease subunit
MTILFLGDPHLKITRFDLALQYLKWVTDIAVKLKPDMVVNLGDTFDTHAVVRSELMTEFKDHAETITAEGIDYWYVLGNHDFYKPTSSKYHALQTMNGFDNHFLVIDQRLDFKNITFLPHIPDHKQFPTDTREICICHQTFIGADYGYNRPDVGVDPDKIKAEIIISGHIHMRQGFGKVIYPGTPYGQSVDDIDQFKGILLFDTETYKQKFIQSPLPMWRGVKVDLRDEAKPDLTFNNKDHWVVEVTGPKAEVIAFRDSDEFKKAKKGCDVKFKPKFTDKEKRLLQIEAVSMDKVMSEWVEKVYQGSIEKQLIVNKGIEILNRVRQQNAKVKL